MFCSGLSLISVVAGGPDRAANQAHSRARNAIAPALMAETVFVPWPFGVLDHVNQGYRIHQKLHMSRQPTLQTMAFLCLFGMQAWLLYRVETALARPAEPRAEASNKALLPVSIATLESNDGAAFAAQISARLSALENRDLNAPRPVSPEETAPIALGGAEALAADRKVEAMLPKEPLTHEDLVIFQAQLGQLPAAERHQLLAALSRAINSGRVRQKND